MDDVVDTEEEELKAILGDRERKVGQCYINGVPTEFGYTLAVALANLISIFHPDPENPRRVKGFEATIETTDNMPVIERQRGFSDLMKWFMTAKFRIMKRRGQVEDAKEGANASALMLVPYQKRIDKFMAEHGWGLRI